MYTQTLAIIYLATAVLASPQAAKRQEFNPLAISASIAVLESQLLPPSSIAAELTGVPTGVQAAITNAAAFSSVEVEFESSIPAWFTSLPSPAQSYILNIGAAAATVLPQISSLEALLYTSTLATPMPGATSYSTGTIVTSSHSNSTVSTSSFRSSTTSSTSTSTGASTTAEVASTTKKTSSSSAGAAPTGLRVVGGLAAAGAGVLGLVMAL